LAGHGLINKLFKHVDEQLGGRADVQSAGGLIIDAVLVSLLNDREMRHKG
jgi:hypothetical protein